VAPDLEAAARIILAADTPDRVAADDTATTHAQIGGLV